MGRHALNQLGDLIAVEHERVSVETRSRRRQLWVAAAAGVIAAPLFAVSGSALRASVSFEAAYHHMPGFPATLAAVWFNGALALAFGVLARRRLPELIGASMVAAFYAVMTLLSVLSCLEWAVDVLAHVDLFDPAQAWAALASADGRPALYVPAVYGQLAWTMFRHVSATRARVKVEAHAEEVVAC